MCTLAVYPPIPIYKTPGQGVQYRLVRREIPLKVHKSTGVDEMRDRLAARADGRPP